MRKFKSTAGAGRGVTTLCAAGLLSLATVILAVIPATRLGTGVSGQSYPLVTTLPASQIAETSATLNGELTALGTGVIEVAAGAEHSLALRADGTLWAWGDNSSGQLGLGDSDNRTIPTQVAASWQSRWMAVAAGGHHSLAIRTDGTLWAWGDNTWGQLGLGPSNTDDKYSPTLVGSYTDEWKAIAAGFGDSLGIRADGTLWAWGYNSSGNLGLGDILHKDTPTQVGTYTDWVKVTAADDHTLGIRADGALWAWGDNTWGELGLGDNDNSDDRHLPNLVGSEAWLEVAAGRGHSLGIRSDGTLWAWGWNEEGQLGLGPEHPGDTNVPTQVGSDTDWTAVDTGRLHSLGIRSDNTLRAWGLNVSGQLGLSDTYGRDTPTLVLGDTAWASMSAGPNHTLGTRPDGTPLSWGTGDRGQLGLGDVYSTNVPLHIDGIVLPDQVWFEWGLTMAYGESTPPEYRDTGGTFQTLLPALSEGMTYNFRACASGGSWTHYGDNDEFTTPAVAPGAPIDLAASPSGWTDINSFSVNWSNPGDPSGIAGAHFTLDSAPTVSGGGDYVAADNITSLSNITLTAEGAHPIYVWLQDGAGNHDCQNHSSTTLYYDAGPPTVSVTSPSGGESYAVGESQDITWIATDGVAVSAIDIYYSMDGGATYPHVIATDIPNDGTYNWTVPDTLSTSCRIRVVAHDAAGNSAEAFSAADFEIRAAVTPQQDAGPPSISVTSPSGGESYAVGESWDITWTATDDIAVSAIDIYYSTDGGATYPYVIATTVPNDGTYVWTVPDSLSTSCRIRVVAHDAAGNSAEAFSEADFEIRAAPAAHESPRLWAYSHLVGGIVGGIVVFTAGFMGFRRYRRLAAEARQHREKIAQWEMEGYDVSGFKRKWNERTGRSREQE